MSSTREVAVSIMLPAFGKVAPAILQNMEDAIEKALRDRDERAAKIVESEVIRAAQLLTERSDEGRDILNYTDFIKGQKTAAQDILADLSEKGSHRNE